MVLFALTALQFASVGIADTVTTDSLRRELSGVIQVVAFPSGKDTILSPIVPRQSSPVSLLGAFDRANPYVLTYLLGNAVGFDRAAILYSAAPIANRQSAFLTALRTDRRFGTALFPMVASFALTRGTIVSGSVGSPRDRRPLVFDSLVAFATRFIVPEWNAARHRWIWSLCAKSTGLVELPIARDDATEAFIYGVVRHAVETGALAPVTSEVDARIAEANRSAPLKSDKKEQRRIQRELWQRLTQNSALRRLLTEEIRSRAAYAPFAVPLGS
ncbi:MAG: hypothetical protein JWM41_894 [Gemmatimonadetes bacterium]|nr:hypothetical protein [Gemmatimonadota bacterium]